MKHSARWVSPLVVAAAVLCAVVVEAQQTELPRAASPAPANAQVILSVEGPGGRVGIGDSLEVAKKACAPPKGATVLGATSFAIFDRQGWTWGTEKPEQSFEVSLEKGKIVGIARTVKKESAQARRKLVEETLAKLGPPTAKAEGKTAAMYAWAVGDQARFLVRLDEGFFGPGVMTLIGRKDELKLFTYRVDDVDSFVKLQDLAAERKQKKQRSP